MSNLEEKIRMQRQAFDDTDPPEGHMERFRQRLEKNSYRPTILIPGKTWLAVAASIAVLVTSLWIATYAGLIPSFGKDKIAGNISEFMEAENYYQHILDERMVQLKTIPIADPGMKERIDHEMDELALSDDIVRKDLKDDPGNEIVMHAIIDHYQTRLNIMNRLLHQLSPITKHSNFPSNENHGTTF